MKAAMYVISLVFLMTLPAFAQVNAVGFAQGNEFNSSSIQGSVKVYCSNGTTADYVCYDTVLDPVSYDYFVGPQGVAANEVTLLCDRPDGSRRDRTTPYDTTSGRSGEAFNLWISTLFQKPLLLNGTNKFTFQLKADGKVVHQGKFNVVVNPGAPRSCPTTHYNSADPVDCESQYSVCQRYFEQYDYCR